MSCHQGPETAKADTSAKTVAPKRQDSTCSTTRIKAKESRADEGECSETCGITGGKAGHVGHPKDIAACLSHSNQNR